MTAACSMATLAERGAEECDDLRDPLEMLPGDLMLIIFRHRCLPLDVRLRAREVSRGWRAWLDGQPELWRDLDFSIGAVQHRSASLLVAAAARAAVVGGLTRLDVSGWSLDAAEWRALVQVCSSPAHRGSLRRVSALTATRPDLSFDDGETGETVNNLLSPGEVLQLCTAGGPTLELLELDGEASEDTLLPMLLRAGPFHALHLGVLEYFADEDAFDAHAFVGAASGHASLTGFDLWLAVLDAPALALLLGYVQSARLSRFCLLDADIPPNSLGAFTSLLRGGCCLRELILDHSLSGSLLTASRHEVSAFCAALRGCKLRSLHFDGMLWNTTSLQIMSSCTSHPTLRDLNFSCLFEENDHTTPFAALVSSVAAGLLREGSRLEALHIRVADAAPLFEALAHNATLKQLQCHFYEPSPSNHSHILQAVRQNQSLRQLELSHVREGEGWPAHNARLSPDLAAAQALVRARSDPLSKRGRTCALCA